MQISEHKARLFTRDILLFDNSRFFSCTKVDSMPSGIPASRFSLMSSSVRDVNFSNTPTGSSLKRFSSSARRLRLVVSRNIRAGNPAKRFLPSSSSSSFPRPRNASADNDEMRLQERSNKVRRLLFWNRPSGKLRSLFQDRSLNETRYTRVWVFARMFSTWKEEEKREKDNIWLSHFSTPHLRMQRWRE